MKYIKLFLLFSLLVVFTSFTQAHHNGYSMSGGVDEVGGGMTTTNADLRYAGISSIGIITANADLRYAGISSIGIITANADLRYAGISSIGIITANADLRYAGISSIGIITANADTRYVTPNYTGAITYNTTIRLANGIKSTSGNPYIATDHDKGDASGDGSEGIQLRAHQKGVVIFTYASGWKERVVVTDNGNVGIGTDDPQNKLDVAGTVSANSYKFSDGTEMTTAASGGGTVTHSAQFVLPGNVLGTVEPDMLEKFALTLYVHGSGDSTLRSFEASFLTHDSGGGASPNIDLTVNGTGVATLTMNLPTSDFKTTTTFSDPDLVDGDAMTVSCNAAGAGNDGGDMTVKWTWTTP